MSDLPGYDVTRRTWSHRDKQPLPLAVAEYIGTTGDGGWDETMVSPYATEQAYDICERIVPEWREMFLEKNRKYRRVGNELGARGVFPDVNRKHGLIRDRVWDQSDVVGEPTREVILDQIGHLFLMLHMIDRGDF